MKFIGIGLSLVGVLVGAGFATGQEATQYFASFGTAGIIGVIIAAIVTALAAIFAMTAGSYFLAEEHAAVFRQISHPVISRILDYGATFTQFAIGFIMIAGAGATIQEQFGLPNYVGIAGMAAAVWVAGMLNVKRVSAVIGTVTPLVILVVGALFLWVLFSGPDLSLSELSEISQRNDSPVKPFWLSGMNYAGMSLACGICMILVMAGEEHNMKDATRGGIVGGILFGVLMIMQTMTIILAAPVVFGSEVPNLTLANDIAPWFGKAASVVIVLMIFNTALGMFYALGRRISSGRQERYRVFFTIALAVGVSLSFFGFGDLISFVYPILGYIGIAIGAALILWRIKVNNRITKEEETRSEIWRIANSPFKASKRDLSKMRQLVKRTAPDDARMREIMEPEIESFREENYGEESNGEDKPSNNK